MYAALYTNNSNGSNGTTPGYPEHLIRWGDRGFNGAEDIRFTFFDILTNVVNPDPIVANKILDSFL